MLPPSPTSSLCLSQGSFHLGQRYVLLSGMGENLQKWKERETPPWSPFLASSPGPRLRPRVPPGSASHQVWGWAPGRSSPRLSWV